MFSDDVYKISWRTPWTSPLPESATGAALPRLEADRGPRRDVPSEALRLATIELESRVPLGEVATSSVTISRRSFITISPASLKALPGFAALSAPRIG